MQRTSKRRKKATRLQFHKVALDATGAFAARRARPNLAIEFIREQTQRSEARRKNRHQRNYQNRNVHDRPFSRIPREKASPSFATIMAHTRKIAAKRRSSLQKKARAVSSTPVAGDESGALGVGNERDDNLPVLPEAQRSPEASQRSSVFKLALKFQS